MNNDTGDTRSWRELAEDNERLRDKVNELELAAVQIKIFSFAFAEGADYYKNRGYHTPTYKSCVNASIEKWNEKARQRGVAALRACCVDLLR